MNTESILDYSIRNLIDFRGIKWSPTEDFFYLRSVPDQYEPFWIRSSFYCFGFISDGELEIVIEDKPYLISKNTVLALSPGQVFKTISVKEGTNGKFLFFTKDFLEHLSENIFSVRAGSFLNQDSGTVFNLKQEHYLRVVLFSENIVTLLDKFSPENWVEIARNMVSALLYEIDSVLCTYFNSQHLDKEEVLVKNFRTLAVLHCQTNRKTGFYCSSLNVSKDIFYNAVKKVTGSTPGKIINQYLVAKAKDQIKSTTYTLTEIAYMLNFPDPFTFSKYFKKQTGFAPLEFRKLSSQAKHTTF